MPSRREFRVVEVTSEEDGHKAAELLEVGPQAKGWVSAKFCIFPQVLVLALERRSTIEKIQFLNHPAMIPTKVEIHVGDVPKGREVDAHKAHFMHLGDLEMENNKSNDQTARQMQSVEITSGAKPCPVLFVKLVFHKNHINKKNQYNQVALAGINIFGQPDQARDHNEEFDLRTDVWSPYDDLAFLMYTDTEVAQLITKLELRKMEAVSTERFEYAKKIKSAISELELAGQKLGTLEIEKKILADRQDYDDARDKKNAMEEYRAKVYQELEIADLLEIQGLVSKNDDKNDIQPNRISKLQPPPRLKSVPPDILPTPRSLTPIFSPHQSKQPLPQINKLLLPPVPNAAILYPTLEAERAILPEKAISPERTISPEIAISPERAISPEIATSPERSMSPERAFTLMTIRETIKGEKMRSRSPSPEPSSPQKLKLHQRDIKSLEVAIEVLGMDTVEKCLSKLMVEKENGFEKLKNTTKSYSSASGIKPARFVKGITQLIVRLLKEKMWITFRTGCNVTVILFHEVITENKVTRKVLSDCTDKIFKELLQSSGESVPRISDLAIDTAKSIIRTPKIEELDVLENLLIKPITIKDHPRMAEIRVDLTTTLVREYGISEERGDPMEVKNLAQFAFTALQHGDQWVRRAGETLILLLYKSDPRTVRNCLPPDNAKTRKNITYRDIFMAMEKCDKNKY